MGWGAFSSFILFSAPLRAVCSRSSGVMPCQFESFCGSPIEAVKLLKLAITSCGVVPGMEKLAAEKIQFELSVSLHAAFDGLRSELMPVNRTWPLDTLLAACAKYTRLTKRAVTFEYTLIKGVNDSRRDALELARRVGEVPLAKVNLIPLSPVSHRPDFATPDEETIMMFLDVLMKRRVQTTIRRSRGKDASAACGQLKLQTPPRPRSAS